MACVCLGCTPAQHPGALQALQGMICGSHHCRYHARWSERFIPLRLPRLLRGNASVAVLSVQGLDAYTAEERAAFYLAFKVRELWHDLFEVRRSPSQQTRMAEAVAIV